MVSDYEGNIHADGKTIEVRAGESSRLGRLLPPQRHLRHITSIQVRNLTPYPTRDAAASVLSEHVTPPFLTLNHALDDADLSVSRRRNRRLSASSTMSMGASSSTTGSNVGEQYIVADHNKTPKMRRRTSSKASSKSVRSPLDSPFHAVPTPQHESRRTTSREGNMNSFPISLDVAENYHTQTELEKIIWSRLMKSYVTITAQSDNSVPPSSSVGLSSPANRSEVITMQEENNETSASHGSSHSRASTLGGSFESIPLNGEKKVKRSISAKNKKTEVKHKSQYKLANHQTKMVYTSTPSQSAHHVESQIPMYISHFHHPSTNPQFILDVKQRDFAPWANLTISNVSISLWGQLRIRKAESAESHPIHDDGGFKPLYTWNLNLSELVPLSEDLLSNPSRLPSNTLLITLSSSEDTYYVPYGLLNLSDNSSRPPSPDYNSDPEGTVVLNKSTTSFSASPLDDSVHTQSQFDSNTGSISRLREKRSVSYQDLVNLVTFQSCILDTEESLREVISKIDRNLEEDLCSLMKREISEREHRINLIRGHHGDIQDVSDALHVSIQQRKSAIDVRRAQLLNARSLHEMDLQSEFEMGSSIAQQRKQHSILLDRIQSLRISLLSRLAFIFPIELLSPPDLLFTILSVPLPIPLTQTDPGPPLSLPFFKEVNEENIATALGYASHLLHLMAIYLSRILIYPITFIGSKSLIKDPISSMIGPRVFPLYSTGVEKYRFEYAVFLLNKNIELLMADKDVLSLDTRHTLPNLKNLLLTLTAGGNFEYTGLSDSSRIETISSGYRSPPNVSSVEIGSIASASESGSSTAATNLSPAKIHDHEASSFPRSKSYLGLPPLSSMFRVRNSTNTTSKLVTKLPLDALKSDVTEGEGNGEVSVDNYPGATDAEDEDDQRTVRGVSIFEDLNKLDDDEDIGKLSRQEKQLNSDGAIVSTSQLTS